MKTKQDNSPFVNTIRIELTDGILFVRCLAYILSASS